MSLVVAEPLAYEVRVVDHARLRVQTSFGVTWFEKLILNKKLYIPFPHHSHDGKLASLMDSTTDRPTEAYRNLNYLS